MTRGRSRLAVGAALLAFAVGAFGVVHELRRPPSPAIVTRYANAHHLLSPSLGAHISRLLHDRFPTDRRDSPRLVALTFDDGPYPVETPLLLDVLRRERVPATFFLVGDDTMLFPSLAKRIEAGGNEIANHTQTHPARFDELDPAGVERELRDGAATLDRYVRDPAIHTLMRPPHGRYTERTVVAAQRAGYAVVLWNDDPGDWRAAATPAAIAAHVGRYATAPEILLLHSGRLGTVRAMPELIRRFRAAGFRFVTVGELLRQVPTVRIEHPERVRV